MNDQTVPEAERDQPYNVTGLTVTVGTSDAKSPALLLLTLDLAGP